MSREVMQQALEALIPLANAASPNERECLTDEDHERAAEALEALCAALAEPDYWQEEARRYAGNADYWRKRYEALAETEHEHNCYGDGNVYRGVRSKDSSVTTYFVRGDLAEPEQEPVAWMADDGTLLSDVTNPKMYTPLYTAPTPRKPLTEDQIVDIWAAVSMGYDDEINIIELARALERAHGIGEQT